MANRILGIEFSPENIKLVEVSYGRRLKVHNFAIVDNRAIDPGRRIDQLNHTLQVRGFESREAMVAVNGVQVEHRLLTLPPLSGRELRFVMQREARKSAPAGVTETSWDFETLHSIEELGIKKRQILLVTSAASLVSEALEFFAGTRLKVVRITTVGESLLNLAQHIGYWRKEAVKNIVHFGASTVHILFVQNGTLLLCRDIPIRYGDLDPDQRFDRLMTEIKRSTLYFRQNFPNVDIDEVFFSGESEMIGGLVSGAKDDLGPPSNVLRFEDNLDSSGFRGEWDEFRFHVPSLAAAFGAAWHKAPGEGLNLLPGGSAAGDGRRGSRKIVKVAAVAAAIACLLVGARYGTRSRAIQTERARIVAERTALDPALEEGARIQAARSRAAVEARFLERMAISVEWAEVLRSLSLIVPESAVFETLRIEGGEQKSLLIAGNLRGPQGEPTNDFAEFFERLNALPYFRSVEMSRPTSVGFENLPADTDQPESPVLISRVRFEVRCVLNSSS